MLVQPGSEGDLIILQHVDNRHLQDGGHIYTFVRSGRFGCAVADPRQDYARFAALLEGEADASDHGTQSRDLACGRNHTSVQAAHVEALPFTGRILCRQVFAQHVGNADSHLMARSGIPDHRADDVLLPIERVNITDRYRFFARTKPGF
jgi:hypothetical protein